MDDQGKGDSQDHGHAQVNQHRDQHAHRRQWIEIGNPIMGNNHQLGGQQPEDNRGPQRSQLLVI